MAESRSQRASRGPGLDAPLEAAMRVICDCGELGSFPAFSSQTTTYTKEVERPSDAARRISAALQNMDRRGLGYLVGAELAAISQSANLLDSHWISSECSATANCGHRHHATTLACAVDNAPTHSPSLVSLRSLPAAPPIRAVSVREWLKSQRQVAERKILSLSLS